MILICGAELFTGNTAMLPAAVYEGKATLPQLLKNWVGSYLGNALGELVVWAGQLHPACRNVRCRKTGGEAATHLTDCAPV